MMKLNSIAAALAVITATLLLPALCQAQTAQPPASGPKTWAVIVGVSKYPKLPGGQQLQFADKDAAAVADALKRAGVSASNLRLLVGPEATASAIKAAIGNWLARSAAPEDTVYIFFSGHGLHEREFGESYLLGFDSDAADPYTTAIAVSDLAHSLSRRVRARNILIVADAMRRDFFPAESDIGSSSKPFVDSFNQIAASRAGASVILASSPGEFSREGQRWGGYGAFARHFVEALAGGADRNSDHAISAEEVFAYLSSHLSADTSNKQNPWRSQTALAQFTIARLAPQAASAPVEIKKEPQPQPAVVAATAAPAPAVTAPAVTAPAVAANASPAPASPTNAPPANAAPPSTAPAKAAAVEKPAARSLPETASVAASAPATAATNPASSAAIASAPVPPPPRPATTLPKLSSIAANPTASATSTVTAPLPAITTAAAPSPLVLQLEAAIASGHLLEPQSKSAWDIYQRLSQEPGAAADLNRLKPMLADALTKFGMSIVKGDVRSDNIADKVDEFKRAGQVFARARAIAGESAEIAAYERLSAAQALVALQFYDEAEKALVELQPARIAAVENALGLVYLGKLDGWRAERAFARAAEMDPKWAAPHYNLALHYRSQKNDAAIKEFEQAAQLDPANAVVLAALGDEYFSRQQWQQAADSYRKAVAARPSDDNLHTKLGHALYSQGLRDEADREYQRARELRNKKP